MYQKDYILRMIEMAARMIAALLGLIKKGELVRAGESLSNLYYDVLKEDAAFFRTIPENELTDTLLHKHNYTNGHLEILAWLFDAEAELEMAQGNRAGCREFSGKSLLLLEFIDREMKTYSEERMDKMQKIRERIENLKKGQET